MLNKQNEYLNYLTKIQQEISVLNLSNEVINSLNFDLLRQSLENIELITPVIGAFSAGKSTLINAFLDSSHLPVNITPETALATELRYSRKERIEAVKADDSIIEYPISDMNKVTDHASEYKLIRLYLSNNTLKAIDPLVLVDMPGFDSPLDLHNKAILEYINRGVHYAVLTSVEEGNLTRSMTRQLADVQQYGRDFSFFLSKANLRADSEVEEIAIRLEEQIDDYLDLDKKVISIGLQGGESLKQVLETIDPEQLFQQLFIDDLKDNFNNCIDILNTSISAMQKDQQANDQDIKELKQGLKHLQRERDSLQQDAKHQYGDASINRIVNAIGREVSNSVDELARTAISRGQDALSQSISEIIRHSLIYHVQNEMEDVSQGVIDKFLMKLQQTELSGLSNDANSDWLSSVADNIQTLSGRAISGMGSVLENKKKNSTSGDVIYKTVTTVLAVTTSVVGPIVELVLVFLPQILGFFSQRNQQDQVREQLQMQVIPSLKRSIRTELPTIFQSQVQHLIQDISEKFETVLEEKRTTIEAAEKARSENIKQIEKIVTQYQLTRDEITSIATKTLYA
jgi:hypothetical protein